MTWDNVAVCVFCWMKRHPDRLPLRVKGAELEPCHFCGWYTPLGIYERVEVDA